MQLENKEIEEIIVRYFDGSIEPSEKAILQAWLKSAEENRAYFLAQHRLWQLSRVSYNNFNDKEAYQAVLSKIHRDKKSQKNIRRTLFYIAGCAAAILLLLLWIYPVMNEKEVTDDLQAYVNRTTRPDRKNKEALLILSNDKKVSLNENESTIDYVSDHIDINNKNSISKEESAVYNELVIPYGKRSSIIFEDGTKAHVNAGTRLVYPIEFRQEKREIYVDGEIYIEVVPDKNRPFIVQTSETAITVLGTSFNVNAYETNAYKNVVLVSGSIKVTKGEKEESILVPDQLCEFSINEPLSIRNVHAADYILWIEGIYQYRGEKLRNILNDLTKYYGIEISCEEKIGNLTYSGKLDLENELPVILKNITKMLPVTYYQEHDKYIIQSNP